MHETAAAASIAANAMLMTFARLGSKVALFKTFCNYQVHPLIVIFHTLIILYGVGTLKKSVYVIRLDLVVTDWVKVMKNSGFGCEMVFKKDFGFHQFKKENS